MFISEYSSEILAQRCLTGLYLYWLYVMVLCEFLTGQHYRFEPENRYGFYGLCERSSYSCSWGKSQTQHQLVRCEMIGCFHWGEWGEMRHGNPIVNWTSVGKFSWLVSDKAAENKSRWCHTGRNELGGDVLIDCHLFILMAVFL